MVNFVCVECGFRFDCEKKAAACPYCDGKKIEKEKSAEELVNSVEIE